MLDISKHISRGYPAIAVETFEDSRFIESILTDYPERKIFQIAARGGLIQFERTNDGWAENRIPKVDMFPDAFAFIASQPEQFGKCVLLVLDFQHSISNAGMYRALLSAMPRCKARGSIVILLSPSWALPLELQHELPVLYDPLPEANELEGSLNTVLEATGMELTKENRAEALQSARGLTRNEAENAFAKAITANGLAREDVEEEKLRLVKSNYMCVEKPRPVTDLGGLGQFKRFISDELIPAKDDRQLSIKAILSGGYAGTGKSLGARVLGAMLGWPVVRASLSEAKGSLVGASEGATKNIFKTARALAPVILYIDEIEKWASGAASSGKTDGGTTSGMLSIALTAIQDIHDNGEQVLLYCTANNIEQIPPELLRRMTAKFFFDLPTYQEREEVARIHLEKYGVEVDGLPAIVAEMTNKFTPSEIEELIQSAARRTQRKIDKAALEAAKRGITPLYGSADVDEMREKAKHLRPANDEAPQVKGRKVGV